MFSAFHRVQRAAPRILDLLGFWGPGVLDREGTGASPTTHGTDIFTYIGMVEKGVNVYAMHGVSGSGADPLTSKIPLKHLAEN